MGRKRDRGKILFHGVILQFADLQHIGKDRKHPLGFAVDLLGIAPDGSSNRF
ncbi:MAG: hypothetical protein SPK64_02970 [Candidatus Enterosoma sp.]|nr:hypothetical protein [Candidatus Enterosoma sp.]